MNSATPLLVVRNLVKHYAARSGPGSSATVRALDGVSLSIERGETVGLVGESGSGKSTLAKAIVGLESPTSGTIEIEGRDLASLSRRELRQQRRRVQMIFQDSASALNPRMTVAAIVEEPLVIHGLARDPDERRARVVTLLDRVGLGAAELGKRPHQLSGGQRQRVGIARALASGPTLLVADEPVSALDVSVAAQVVNLLSDLQASDGLALLFVAHDLRLVRHLCRRIAVLYLGKVVETGACEAVFSGPAHPYTRALLAARFDPHAPAPAAERRRLLLEGDPPSPVHPPSGCRFHPRCPVFAGSPDPRCRERATWLGPLADDPRHYSDCHLARRVEGALP